MKAVILAGGFGTRIGGRNRPQTQAHDRDRWKAYFVAYTKIFSAHGINEFVICCGYKGYVIKEYISLITFCI